MKDEGLNQPQDIKERTFEFAVRVLKMTKYIPPSAVNKVLITQVIRSASSIGANIEEAQGAHTKSDFAHCLNISKKEARETYYWLRLIGELNPNVVKRLKLLLNENEELIKILTAIVKKVNPRNFNP